MGLASVHQVQLAALMVVRGRIEEHASLQESAVEVGHQRADVARE